MADAREFGSAPALISIAAGTFTPPGGDPHPYQATSFRHWCDMALAAACFAEAQRLMNDSARVAALSGEGATAQSQYVFKILSWVANGFNALGIEWFNDPVTRALYRRSISGGPMGSNEGAWVRAQFDLEEPYRLGWYDASFPWPQIPNAEGQQRDAEVGNSPLAGLPLQASQQLDRYGGANARNTRQWVQLCGLYTDTVSRDITDPRSIEGGVSYASEIRNRAFAWLPSRNGREAALWTDGHEEDPSLRFGPDEMAVRERFNKAVIWGGVAYGDIPGPPTGVFVRRDGSRSESAIASWDDFAYDEQLSIVSVPLKVSNPLRDYLGLWADIINACVSRSPADIIAQSRLYVLWQNGKTISANTSVRDAIMSRDADLERDRTRPDRTADLILNATSAIAPAVATIAPPYGAIIALGIIAVTTAGRVINAAVSHGLDPRRKRNDLGYFKPQLERAQIGGSLTDDGGTPPAAQVPAPPGWRRPLVLRITPGLFLGGGAAPPPLDGKSILDALGLGGPPGGEADVQGWDALSSEERDRRLTSLGFGDPAARAAALQAVENYLHPRAPLPMRAPKSSTLLLVGAAALAAWMLFGRKR